ncbi:MAG TPA: HAD family hydrolase [Chryseosolibacter sp.]|nr:HAD family hydrolase [Chryseosolibacter sp.]
MKKRALIFDLDNTIFPVTSIGGELFRPLFDMLRRGGMDEKRMKLIEQDVMRKPFQWVAARYSIGQDLASNSAELLKTLEYNGAIEPFADFAQIRACACDKFIVTMGFRKMQLSKIRSLELEKDFKEIFIIDPTVTKKTKKDVFQGILDKFGYSVAESLVIGDDRDSEIEAAITLGIDSVLYDKENVQRDDGATFRITSYEQLMPSLECNGKS